MSSSGLCVLCQCKFDGEDRKSVILVCSHTMCSVCFKIVSIEDSVVCPLCWYKKDSLQQQNCSDDNFLSMSFTLDEPEAKENIQVNADVDDLKKNPTQGNHKIDGINFSEVSNNNSMASSRPRSKLSHKFGLEDKNKANLPSHFEGFLTSFSIVGQYIYFKLKGVEEKRLFDHFHNDFKNTMNKLCCTPNSKMTKPVKGDLCAAVTTNGEWFRAFIEYTNSKIAIIFLVDVGVSCKIRLTRLAIFKIPQRFMEMPAQAVCCEIDGVFFKKAPKVSNLPREYINFWQKKINKSFLVFINSVDYKPKWSSRPLSDTFCLRVTMYMEGVDESVNRQLLRLPMAIFRQKYDYPHHESIRKEFFRAKTTKTSEETESTINSSNSVQLCPSVDRPLKKILSWKLMGVSSAFPTQLFKGIVTSINRNGELFFYDVKWQNQLNEMRQRMKKIYDESQPTAFDRCCKPGDPCVALFEDYWFRARVTSVDRKFDRVAVFFVDYGKTEIVDKDCVRRNIIYQDVPVQTFSASLYNFSTLLSNADMSDCGEKALDRICGLLIDKVCTICVKSVSPLQVSLQCNLQLNLG